MFRLDTKRLRNGNSTTILYNTRGIAVANIQDHHMTVEETFVMAQQFEQDNPELFGGAALVDTLEQSQKRNANQYGAGKLFPVPEA